MAQERKFVAEAIKRSEIEEFLEKEFSRAGYSHTDIQRTPLAMRITVYAHKPGLIIGRGGKNIDKITRILKTQFGFENPQLDVQEIRDPNLDSHIVAKHIAGSIERGTHYKRVANMAVQRVMHSGAIGIAVRISGKVGGNMSRVEKFQEGYLKFAGDTAETLVDTAYATAHVKLGTIGIQVRILTELPSDRITIKKLMQTDNVPLLAEEQVQEKVEEVPVEEPEKEIATKKVEEEMIEEVKEEIKEEVNKNGDNKEETDERTE